MTLSRIACGAVAACALALALPPRTEAGQVFQVSADTKGLSGTSGYLDFQFNPGPNGSPPAVMTVKSFDSVGGTLTGPPALTGGANGDLTGGGTLWLDNSTGYNDAFIPFTFGTSLSFLVSMPDITVSNPALSASAFGFSLYDQTGTIALSQGTGGEAVWIDLNPDGTAKQSASPAYMGGESPLVQAVPEPPTLIPAGMAALLMAGAYLRGWRKAA